METIQLIDFETQTPISRTIRPRDVNTMTLFMSGYTPGEIASEKDIAEAAVCQAIRRGGKEPKRYSYTQGQVERWAFCYTDPDTLESVASIARRYGRSPGLISTALLRHGVRLRHAHLSIKLAARKRRDARNRKGRQR